MLFHFNSHIFGCFLAAFFLIVSHVARYAPSSSEEIASKIISNILSVNFYIYLLKNPRCHRWGRHRGKGRKFELNVVDQGKIYKG